MAGERKFRIPALQGTALWMPITALLALGLLTTLIDISALPASQATLATANEQRIVIDANTGEVMRAAKADGTAETTFDVDAKTTSEPEPASTAEEPPATTPEATADAEVPTPTEAPDVATPAESAAEPVAESEAVADAASAAPMAEVEASEPEPVIEGAASLRTEPMLAKLNAPTPTKHSLVPAPAPEVSETVDGKTLPKRGDKDVIPSKLYAHPFTRKPDQALLSFVVMNAGIDPQAIGLLMALPPEVSVAYSPYARPASSYSEHVRATGHEVWTMLPTMNAAYPASDPGPMGIIARMPSEEIIRRTREVLAAIAGSVGLVLPPDETVANQPNTLAAVLAEINARGLLMLSTNPSRNIDQISNNAGMKQIIRRADLIIDEDATEAEILSKLAGVVAAAKEKGEYVVMLSARPQKLKLLTEWLQKNPLAEPVVLAPLSAIYQPKEIVEAPAAEGGEAPKKEKPKPKPAEKKQKPLPQDQYLKPAGAEAGGEKKSAGH
jgi:polysaccharide deacetylase 2 family uncharacterized protein YibQ